MKGAQPLDGPPDGAHRSYLPFYLVGAAIAIAATLMVARGFLAGSYKVASGSMVPSIAMGEHVLVNKTDKTAGLGKIVVFLIPGPAAQGTPGELVKRVVGMPGDTVEIRGDALVLNGAPVPTCAVGAWSFTDEGQRHDGDLVGRDCGSSRGP